MKTVNLTETDFCSVRFKKCFQEESRSQNLENSQRNNRPIFYCLPNMSAWAISNVAIIPTYGKLLNFWIFKTKYNIKNLPWVFLGFLSRVFKNLLRLEIF